MPDGSIGERLQQAKVYLDTPDLFAWTFVIVAISLGFEKLVLFLLRRCAAALQTDTLTGGKAVLNPTQGDAQPLICVKNLCKAYHGKEVLNHLNLRIQKGEITALMAPSGWGKTTFLRILAGLEEPDAGEITGLEGSRFSAVFQEDRLCPGLSAPLNIRLVNPGHSAAEVLGRMEALGLSDCAEQPVFEFSGGMKRRTAILRALLAEYDVLFLDEPFKGLDLETRAQVLRVFREMTVEKTILFVTHEPEEAQALGAKIIRLPEAAHPADTQKM